jgi:ATP-dependent DNA ligase
MASFEPLTSVSKAGKTMDWSIAVEEVKGEGVIIVTRGYRGGAVQTDTKTVSEGKNLGKKNETTPFQQAVLEARATWNKKQAEGYVVAVSNSSSSNSSSSSSSNSAAASMPASRATELILSAPLPMLANKWPDRKKYIQFPCLVQPKYDGTRTIAICGLKEGPCLFSRQRKAYAHLEHIQAIVRKLPKGLILDGELFTTKAHFQTIVGLAKKKTLTEEDRVQHNLLELHCYDIVDATKPFTERYAMLQDVFRSHAAIIGTTLQLCPTREVAKESDLKPAHDAYVAAKFEGLMIRNKAGLYAIGNRSNDLLKMKEFEDDEFRIIGFYEADGAEKGCVMWRCITPKGVEFGCRPEGTREDRQELFKHGSDYVGKMLTVRFQELTPDGVPRFPVGVTIRDYE